MSNLSKKLSAGVKNINYSQERRAKYGFDGTLNSWLKLPRKIRYKYKFWYNIPLNFQSGEWSKWRDWIKKNHLIQYWLREVLWWEISYYFRRVCDIRIWVKNLIWPHNVIKLKGLSRSWSDSDTKIEAFLQQILFNYIEQEKAFEVIDWDWNPEQQQIAVNLKEAYDWFKTGRQKYQTQVDLLMDKLYGSKDFFDEINKPRSPKWLKQNEELEELEKMIEKTDTKWYLWLVKYRGSLWT